MRFEETPRKPSKPRKSEVVKSGEEDEKGNMRTD